MVRPMSEKKKCYHCNRAGVEFWKLASNGERWLCARHARSQKAVDAMSEDEVFRRAAHIMKRRSLQR